MPTFSNTSQAVLYNGLRLYQDCLMSNGPTFCFPFSGRSDPRFGLKLEIATQREGARSCHEKKTRKAEVTNPPSLGSSHDLPCPGYQLAVVRCAATFRQRQRVLKADPGLIATTRRQVDELPRRCFEAV
jgi:hypothetical protein